MGEEFRILTDESFEPGALAERDGVHFGYYAAGEEPPALVLYRRGTQEIAAEIPFPRDCGPGRFYHMKVKLRASGYEYNFREGERIVTDPYARKVVGREVFGQMPSPSPHALRGGFLTRRFSWEGDVRPGIPASEAVLYQLHVRGFTKEKHSGVRRKGTFAGLQEKLPYLAELGVNQVKLMPAYEFPEMVRQRAGQGIPAMLRPLEEPPAEETCRLNYWGYGPGYYFAPKRAYAAGPEEDLELKALVKAAHALGMEILMEFYFPEETDLSLMVRCLAWWAQEYHVDGFHVMAREGVAAELARMPLFTTVKLLGNWFPQGIGAGSCIAECNDGFMNDCRRMLKGDEGMLESFAWRMRRNPAGCGVVNYMTNHDGFTLADLVSYDRKHNLDNGEQERDGTDYNYSWNCGLEGATRKREIRKLRQKQQRNAFAMLIFAQGVPMLLSGDEFGNSQDGNNNPYCHDGPLTWVDWGERARNQELWAFVRDALAYRKAHPVFRQETELTLADQRSEGFPDLSYHGDKAWYCDFSPGNRSIGFLYSGRYAGEEGLFYLAWNFHWNGQECALPLLPKGQEWYRVMDTSLPRGFLEEPEKLGTVKSFLAPARSVILLESRG